MAYCYENGFLISEFLEKIIIRKPLCYTKKCMHGGFFGIQ